MTSDEKQLLKHFRSLSAGGKTSLLDFAEFLAARDPGPVEDISPTPLAIPRPAEESVVKAIKRLRATYPMLARDTLLHETSALMTKHVIHRHPAVDVIDELESLFKRHYDAHLQAPPDSEL